MIDAIIAGIPVVIGFGTIVAISLQQLKAYPIWQPEVVLVRSPYGYPKKMLNEEMNLHEISTHHSQFPIHYLQFPIRDQNSVERAMTEIGNRISFWRKYFQTPWFVIHSPKVSHTSYIETLLTTHGFRVNVMDVPIPTKDGFPSEEYYKWAEQCPFVRKKEDIIQEYHTSWQSWPNTGRQRLIESEDTDNTCKDN